LVAAVLLVGGTEKISVAWMLSPEIVPIETIVTGIPGAGLVVNVVVVGLGLLATTASAFDTCWNCRMLAAFADVASASEARHAMATRVSGKRIGLLLPL